MAKGKKRKAKVTRINDLRKQSMQGESDEWETGFELFTHEGVIRAVLMTGTRSGDEDRIITGIFSDGSCQGESLAEILGFRNDPETDYGEDDDCRGCDLCSGLIEMFVDCDERDCDECGLCEPWEDE